MTTAPQDATCGHALAQSDEQRCVVEAWRAHRTSVISVIAKAGTGKTTLAGVLCCTARAHRTRVLLVSFSTNGLKELVREVNRVHGAALHKVTNSCFRAPEIEARTFDSLLHWGLDTLGLPEARLGLAPLSWQVAQLAEIGGRGLRGYGEHVNPRLWTRYNFDTRLRELCDLVSRGQSLSIPAEAAMGHLLPVLERTARATGMILPSDYAAVVMAHAEQVAALIDERFDLVIVDECQDSSERDLAALVALARRGRAGLVLLGDEGQAVMRFRGALGDVALHLESKELCLIELALTINYRSTRELVAAANDLQLAGGWRGPLARPAPWSLHGPRPLLVRLSGDRRSPDPDVDETGVREAALVEMSVRFLHSAGCAASDDAVTGQVPREVSERIAAVGRWVRDACHPRPALVECLVPTRAIGAALSGALAARGIDHVLVLAPSNPFDSELARLLWAWFDATGDACEQLRYLLATHANHAMYGASSAAREELRACSDTVLGVLERATDRSRPATYARVLTAVERALLHPAVGTEGRAYLQAVRRLAQAFVVSADVGRLDDALEPLSAAIGLLAPWQGRRAGGGGQEPAVPFVIAELRGDGVSPMEVPRWLRRKVETWRKNGELEPDSGVVIKTGVASKGDTCDAVVAVHAERFPFPPRASSLSAGTDNAELLPQAYVPYSRARYAVVALGVGTWPRWHTPPLSSWDYLES